MATTSVDGETELVTRAQQGDRGAFSELVQCHYAGVINVVYHLCGDPRLAEDAAQEAFLRAWLHLDTYRPRTAFRHWLYRIAVNAALDSLRRDTHVAPESIEDLALPDAQPGPESVLAQAELAVLVQQALLALPAASRVVLVLREYEGLSYQSIAATLDIPVGTVMSRLNYARNRLRAVLEPQLRHGEGAYD